MPFGRQGSFPQGQGSPEHSGCWAACPGLGTSLGIPPPSSWKGELTCNTTKQEAQLRLGTSGTLAIKSQGRTQAGQGRERRISRQGCPKRCLLAPRGDLRHNQGASQGLVLPRARVPTHKVLGGHKDRHQHTSPQPNSQQAARAALGTSYRHRLPPPSQLPPCPEPGQATHTASYLRASQLQLLFPKPLLQHLARSTATARLPHPPTLTSLNAHTSALPPDTSSASLGSASPRSTPAVPCTLPLTPRVPGPTELPVVQTPSLPNQHPCATSEPCMHSRAQICSQGHHPASSPT